MSIRVRQTSLLRASVAASGWAVLGLMVGMATAALVRPWGLLVGVVVALVVSYTHAAWWHGKSGGDRLLAVVWTLASYVLLIVLAVAVLGVLVAGGMRDFG